MDRAAGRMFPRVYLEVPVRVYLRVSLWMTCVAQHDFVEGVLEAGQPRKIFCQCDSLRHPFATLFFPHARAELARYLRALRAGGLVHLCCSTWFVAVGGDEALYVSRPRLKQMT